MELQFQNDALPCLKRLKREVQNQEQTQELRLPDGMPDIASVLGAWGQVILRSKEWHTGTAGISGGVMAWVLYAPEDDPIPRSVEVWIPFQIKWDLPDTDRDGVLNLSMILRGIDARMLSARKLLVRAGFGVCMEAWIPDMLEISRPGELPPDVQLLRKTYPIQMVKEAGEKPFSIEEDLPLDMPVPEKIVSYRYHPEITDCRIMGDRVVFRGSGTLKMLCQEDTGELRSKTWELPFSQFTELEREYGESGSIRMVPVVTGAELEMTENGLRFHGSVTCQYLVSDRPVIELVEDAYSPHRQVRIQKKELQIPNILQEKETVVPIRQSAEDAGGSVADVTFLPDHPHCEKTEDGVTAHLQGQFQMLSRDENGVLQGRMLHWEEDMPIPGDENSQVELLWNYADGAQGTISMDQGELTARGRLAMTVSAQQGLSMVTALEMGEMETPDPDRPSLILRRCRREDLWDIARETGSTVEAIRKANHLTSQPEENQILLIPIP